VKPLLLSSGIQGTDFVFCSSLFAGNMGLPTEAAIARLVKDLKVGTINFFDFMF